jgi:hypothetical protein
MTCPRCGNATEPSSGACVSCGIPLPSGAVTAIGVATPIPPLSPRAGHGPPPDDGTDPDATDLGLAGAFIDPEVTRVPASPTTRNAAPPDPDVTAIPAATFDPEVTRVPAVQDVDVTRVPVAQDVDVTRVPTARPSDDDETSMGGPPAASLRGSRGGGTRAGRSRGGQTLGGFGEVATDLVGKDLGDRYHIIKLLGAGGMGAVYQAWDGELGVAVALKTVRPEVAADPSTARMLEQRFKQELLLARKVTHKNIVRVHDIGELDGLKYITMPFV